MFSEQNALDVLEITNWQFIDEINNPTEQGDETTFEALREQISACTLCALSKSRTHTVFGEGSAQAEIMFVGEAPGMHEDQQGRPFVGRAGQLLTSMLQAMQVTRESVFIGNILKCRPPQNRDPSHEEVLVCTPFLDKQIEMIRPKVIVALGRHAAHYLLNTDQTLGRLRQKWHRYKDCDLLVTYHPAYLLRNPSDKRKAWDDLCLLKSKLDSPS